MTPTNPRPLAVVTGASSGIGYSLALRCVEHGFDLVIAADEPLAAAAEDFRLLGADVWLRWKPSWPGVTASTSFTRRLAAVRWMC
jgi:NAD(P)-dependent dehydrogenase (short-subunit alcohol dehydrogenase family)